MSFKNVIETKLRDVLGDSAEIHLILDNESCGRKASIHIISDRFGGMTRLNRHKLVNDCLREEIRANLHALSIKAVTHDESISLANT